MTRLVLLETMQAAVRTKPITPSPTAACPQHAPVAVPATLSPTCGRGEIEVWLTEHGEMIARLTHRLLAGHADAIDVTQDVFVIALEQGHRFRGDAPVEVWLRGIAIRLCRKWVRRTTLRRNGLRIWGLAFGRHESPADTTLDEAEAAWSALRNLRARDREVLVLRYLEELTIDQIASTLGVSRGTIDQRLTRARERMHQFMRSSGDNP